MPARRSFEDQLAALDALRQQAPESAAVALRKALAHRNNYVVAKAAELVRELALAELIPEVLAAFERFFSDPVKTDPQCWAKNALSRALAAFEHQDAVVFLQGTAAYSTRAGLGRPLRYRRSFAQHLRTRARAVPQPARNGIAATCSNSSATKISPCTWRRCGLSSRSALPMLLFYFGCGLCSVPTKRKCWAPAMAASCGLRARARFRGSPVFLPPETIPAAEAALAIASDRSPESFRALHQRFVDDAPCDPWFRSGLLSATALTRQPEGIDFLLDLVRQDTLHSEPAIEALLRSGPSAELVRQLERTVSGNPRLARFVADHQAQQR